MQICARNSLEDGTKRRDFRISTDKLCSSKVPVGLHKTIHGQKTRRYIFKVKQVTRCISYLVSCFLIHFQTKQGFQRNKVSLVFNKQINNVFFQNVLWERDSCFWKKSCLNLGFVSPLPVQTKEFFYPLKGHWSGESKSTALSWAKWERKGKGPRRNNRHGICRPSDTTRKWGQVAILRLLMSCGCRQETVAPQAAYCTTREVQEPWPADGTTSPRVLSLPHTSGSWDRLSLV